MFMQNNFAVQISNYF